VPLASSHFHVWNVVAVLGGQMGHPYIPGFSEGTIYSDDHFLLNHVRPFDAM
jgi:hypothetical protein